MGDNIAIRLIIVLLVFFFLGYLAAAIFEFSLLWVIAPILGVGFIASILLWVIFRDERFM